MADLLSRPARERRDPRPRRGPDRAGRPRGGATAEPPRPVSVAGLVAAVTSAAQSLLAVLVLVLVGWATAADSAASVSEAFATALQVWLVGHHAQLVLPGGDFQLVPLGLLALPAALLFGAATRAARAAEVVRLRGVAALTSVLASSYAIIGVLAALLARTDDVRPVPVSAFLGAGGLALVAGGAGALNGTRRTRGHWLRLPAPARLVLTGSAGALAALIGAGALLGAASLVGHQGRVTDLGDSLDAGATGGLIVLLLGLAYVPTLVVWGVAYLLGPGFAVGAGTSVAPGGVDLGAVPAFPLLGALPGDGPAPPAVAVLALLVPLLAGAGAALLAERRDQVERESSLGSWRGIGEVTGGCALVTGVVLAVLAVLASGPVGPGRMAEVGPTPWVVGLAAVLEVGVGAGVTLLVRRGPRLWSEHRAARRASSADGA